MYAMDESPLFSFCGRHCEELGVAFLPTQYPFVPAQTVPALSVSGRHGTLRYPGRTFRPRAFKGTLYLLGEDDEPITTAQMLRRASDVAAWLCGRDGRGELILDALPDRCYIAEVDTEALLRDSDWANGAAAVCFTCQPFARSLREVSVTLSTEANAARSARISPGGNFATPLAFDVKNASSAVMDTAAIETDAARFDFVSLALGPGETLSARYTEDDILLLAITGVQGEERSAMAMRTPQSDDDLMLAPGGNRITIRTQRACEVILKSRGRWL